MDKPLHDMREMPLGFAPLDLLPGEKKTLKATVKTPPAGHVYRGERLVIVTKCNRCPRCGVTQEDPAITVTDLRAAGKSQLVEAAALPAMVFSETAVGVRLSLDKLKSGEAMEIDIRHTGVAAPWWRFWKRDKPTRVQAVIFGTEMPEGETGVTVTAN